jgi:hypothetical protein
VTALLRYQTAILLRSHRWIFPLIAYGLLIAVGAAGSTSLAETLDWTGAMLVPVVAFLTRGMLTAEPDAARACVCAAAGPVRAQLATLIVPLGAGAVLGLAATVFDVLTAEAAAKAPVSGLPGKVTAAADHPGIVLAGLLIALVCLLVGSAVGALCNPPLLRHPAAAMLSTLAAIILALASGVSPRQRGHQPHHRPVGQPPRGELAGNGPADQRGLPGGRDLGGIRDRRDAPRHLVREFEPKNEKSAVAGRQGQQTIGVTIAAICDAGLRVDPTCGVPRPDARSASRAAPMTRREPEQWESSNGNPSRPAAWPRSNN